MIQHVISEWLLKAFARGPKGSRLLARYDKASDEFDEKSPAELLTEVDAHSAGIEAGISQIESPASQAALRLAKRTRHLQPGLYAIGEPGAAESLHGPAVAEVGTVDGMRFFVTPQQIESPLVADRRALGIYLGLMYQRGPEIEAQMLRLGIDYEAAAQGVLDSILPGIKTGIRADLEERRSRMLAIASEIGEALADANWWVMRAIDDECFVLSDTPVAATVSLGHDDQWRAILSDESYVVVMPIGPKVALLIAPRLIIPVSGIGMDPGSLTHAINRLTWRNAGRSVLAGSRADLERAWPDWADLGRRSVIQVGVDRDAAINSARRESRHIAMIARYRFETQAWQHWSGCHLGFGWVPWPAEDRGLFRPRHG